MERPYPAFDETVQAMGELIKEGKIKYWGLSNESTFGEALTCLEVSAADAADAAQHCPSPATSSWVMLSMVLWFAPAACNGAGLVAMRNSCLAAAAAAGV